MTIESVSIDSVTGDPANARKHSPRNLGTIQASLKRFGQQKPIVVDGRGIVRAGNGTLAAAKSLGWTSINIVRTDLAGADATAFAIADNRTSDLSDWDEEALGRQLEGLAAEGLDLIDIGFTAREAENFLGEGGGAEEEELGEAKWLVVVTCKDEADQRSFIEQMDREGKDCRALMA